MAKKNEKPEVVSGEIFESALEEVMSSSMLPYAEFVILERALPRVEDGLKPVQRRILYTMSEMGLTPDKPHKKSARIVGDCMGKYHPHGDSSVYDAMVRMAQDFNMRMMLVDGHGNFGSVDGDGAAAMRYTEARLQPLALELLRDLDKNTVRFGLNFDDSLTEPETLPGRFPNLLVNGASGIAVGLATNIPPHNLGEVIDGVIAYIESPSIKLKDMMKYIKGPDFPTGGYVITNELEQAYETGRGKIIMRARYLLEQSDYDRTNMVITELPYQVNKALLLKKIAALREEKKDMFAGIANITDESDRKGMRAVIQFKKDTNVRRTVENLFKYSDLECSFGINMVAIADGKPRQMGLIEIIKYYVEYQREVILRRTKFDLNAAKERCHIIEGLIIAVQNIDEVVQIIKRAASVSDARQKLRERFKLSEKQAQAILDLRLARLTKLEVLKLQDEYKELQERIKYLQSIVDSKRMQMQVVCDELKQIKRQFKSERRTQIVGEIKKITAEHVDAPNEASDVVLVYTADGKLKYVTDKNYKMTDKGIVLGSSLGEVFLLALKTTSDKVAYAFTNMGNCYKLNLSKLTAGKLRDKAGDFKSLIPDAQDGERPVAFFEGGSALPKGNLMFFTKLGYIKKAAWSEYALLKNAFLACKLKEGDEVIGVESELTGGEEPTTIFYVTKNGLCLNAQTDNIPEQGRVSGGVRGINLTDDDYVVMSRQTEGAGEAVIITANNLAKRVVCASIEPMARYRKGVKIVELSKGDSVMFACHVTEPYSLALANSDGELIELATEDVPIESRTTKGKALKNKKFTAINVFSLEYNEND